MKPNRPGLLSRQVRPLNLWVALFATGLTVLALATGVGIAATTTNGQAKILSPNRVGGATGSDERAVDIYPVVAYDPMTQHYLAVWMTLRNAQSSSAGFDVYGVFLDSTGRPFGSEFRISDNNTVARSGFPTVAAGNGEFTVAWTARGTPCRIYVQRVVDTSPRSDRVLVSASGHSHSPSLVYNSVRQRFALTYVEGDDYLPPTSFGVQTDDCGNNASSTSRIKALEFYFNGDEPVGGTPLIVSDGNPGAFRPRLAYSAGLNQYLAVWEDRRNAGGQAYRFDVYAQRLGSDMMITEGDISLATGGDYTNYDTSATWTPRPVVAGGDSHFLTTWFAREVQDSAVIWSLIGLLVPTGEAPGTPFVIAEMSFAQSHAGQPPTGFLSADYISNAREYMVGMTSYLESVWGYLSFALVQRIASDGQLLNLDGSPQGDPGVGSSVDYDNDDQISIAMATNPRGGAGKADYMIVYGKHPINRPAQDFDVWGVRVQIPAFYLESVYLPVVLKETR